MRLPAVHAPKRAGWLASCGVAAGALAAPAGAALPSDEDPEARRIAEAIRAQEDPTILSSRAWMEAEWNDDLDGSDSLELTLGARKSWRISDRHDWAFQLELPYRRTTDGPGGNLVSQGIADIKVTAGTAVRLSDTVRIGGGLELRMPTGDGDVSGNIWRLQEFAAVAWDATPWLTFTPKVRYFHTIARENGASPQHYAELYVPATFILADRWSLTARYELKRDFVSDYMTHAAKLTVGRQLSRPDLGLSLALKVPFNSLSNEYQLVFNVTHTF